MWVTPKQTDRALHVLGSNYSQDFIQFYEFLKILNVCTDKNFTQIAQYLINSDEFLKLDFYNYDVNYHNSKDPEYEFTSKSDILSNISIDHKFNFYRYDSFKNSVPQSFPIENFLSEISQDNYLSEFRKRDLELPLPDYYSYFWKVEDILKVDYIARLGLDADTFAVCKEVVTNGSSIILDYYRENEKLKEQLKTIGKNTTVNQEQLNTSHLDSDKNQKESHLDKTTMQSVVDNSSYIYNWENANQYTYPPELHLALILWEKIYISEKTSNLHINKHSDRFNLASNKIGLDPKIYGAAIIDRLKTVTNPQKNKPKKEIENFSKIKMLDIKDLNQGNPQG